MIFFFFWQLFEFADKYRGKYDSSITLAQKYYRSVSGYGVNFNFAKCCTVLAKLVADPTVKINLRNLTLAG